MIDIKNVSLSYKKNQVINNISFSVNEGQCIGLLGTNGSGKSTLLSAISGAKRIDSGDISVDDISLSENPSLYKKNIGYVTQENPLIPDLSAMDNLRLWSSKNRDEILSLLSTPPLSILGVADFIKVKVNKMSGGMKKRLSIASVLIENPKVLLMDEPFAALDMVAKHDILDYIKYFVSNGGIVIIASHEEAIFDFCTNVYLINNHQLINTKNLPENISYVDLLRSSK